MKTLFPYLLILGLVLSCKKSPQKHFQKEKISFTCPSGWAITEEENLDNEGYYLSIEKDGFDSSGLVTITWIESIIDLNLWLDLFINEFNNNFIVENSNFSFDNPTYDEYNSIETLSVNYKGVILGVEHIGVIHAFHSQNKTFAILRQEATEDIKKNKSGFTVIEQSFSTGN